MFLRGWALTRRFPADKLLRPPIPRYISLAKLKPSTTNSQTTKRQWQTRFANSKHANCNPIQHANTDLTFRASTRQQSSALIPVLHQNICTFDLYKTPNKYWPLKVFNLLLVRRSLQLTNTQLAIQTKEIPNYKRKQHKQAIKTKTFLGGTSSGLRFNIERKETKEKANKQTNHQHHFAQRTNYEKHLASRWRDPHRGGTKGRGTTNCP